MVLCAQGSAKCSFLPILDSSGSRHSPGLLATSPEAQEAQRKLRSEAIIWRIQPHLRQLSEQIGVTGEGVGPGTRRPVSGPGSATYLLRDVEQVPFPLRSTVSSVYPFMYFFNKCVLMGSGLGTCAYHDAYRQRATTEDQKCPQSFCISSYQRLAVFPHPFTSG